MMGGALGGEIETPIPSSAFVFQPPISEQLPLPLSLCCLSIHPTVVCNLQRWEPNKSFILLSRYVRCFCSNTNCTCEI